MVDAMAKDGAARLRLRPVGAADRKKLPEYGPLGTGCPAIERAVAALYKGQNEESFWALMNAINYALELDTRVLVPLEAASDQPDGAAPWAEHPVPAEKAKDLQPWTLRTQKGRCYLPVFTSVKMAEADKGTASRPMAERLLASAMQMALDSDSIDGVVIDPWTSSATLDCSLLNGLLHASHDTDEPGEAELRAGNRAMAEERWDDAMHYYQLSAEEGCAEGLAMMGEMLYEGRGCRKSPAQARKFWKKPPTPAMWPHGWRWATMPWCREKGPVRLCGPTARPRSSAPPPPTSPICRRSACGWLSMRPSISPAKRRWLSWLRRSRASSSAKKRGTRRPRAGWTRRRPLSASCSRENERKHKIFTNALRNRHTEPI